MTIGAWTLYLATVLVLTIAVACVILRDRHPGRVPSDRDR